MAAQARTDRLIRWGAVCVDCSTDNFEDVVAFYRDILQVEVSQHEKRWAALMVDDRCINIQAQDWYVPPVWPEDASAQTKMIHFEMDTRDMEAAVALVIRSGGMEAPHQPHDRDPNQLRVMLDPAGHPFCICA